MPEIEITYPKIEINILEIDDYIPSFKISLYHHNEGINYKNDYYCEFWIKTHDWDIFVNNLKGTHNATLQDMSNNDRIIIINNTISLFFSQNKPDFIIDSKCIFNISEDELKNIITYFSYFPKWW